MTELLHETQRAWQPFAVVTEDRLLSQPHDKKRAVDPKGRLVGGYFGDTEMKVVLGHSALVSACLG